MWSFLGSMLGTQTKPVEEEKVALTEFEAIESEAEEGWEDVTEKRKRVTFQDDDQEFFVVYKAKKPLPKEGKVASFEKIGLVIRDVDSGFVDIDIDDEQKEIKQTTKSTDPIELVFIDRFADVTSLL